MTKPVSPDGRVVGFPDALRVLWSWVGKRVEVRIKNSQGRDLTSPIAGVLSNHSEGDHVEFGIYEPDDAATTLPVRLEAPDRCVLGDGTVSVAMAGDIVIVFSRTDQAKSKG